MTILGSTRYGVYLDRQVAAVERGGDHYYWVAERAGAVVGAVEFRLRGDVWFLNNVHVSVSERGRGIGSRLLGVAAQAGARFGCRRIALDVFEDNEPARVWYSRLGFEMGSRTVYAEVPWAAVPIAEGGHLSGIPQAQALLESYGFAMLTAFGDTTYSVGLLNDRWFRAMEPALHGDGPALGALRHFDDQRRLLFVHDYEFVDELPTGTTVRAVAHRMSRELAGFRT